MASNSVVEYQPPVGQQIIARKKGKKCNDERAKAFTSMSHPIFKLINNRMVVSPKLVDTFTKTDIGAERVSMRIIWS